MDFFDAIIHKNKRKTKRKTLRSRNTLWSRNTLRSRKTLWSRKTLRSRKTLKKIKPLNCNPSITAPVQQSCMTMEALLLLRDEYNKDHPINPIIAEKPSLIWYELKMRLQCEDERCWLGEIDDPQKRAQIQSQLFAPDYPPEWIKNPIEWLTNIDIDKVMAQYQQKYADFEYLGTTSIDYDYIVDKPSGTCVEDMLCKFDLKKSKLRGKQRFAAVFNLDKHDEPGSHWVSLFISIPKKTIVFFDSANGGVPIEIRRFVKMVQKQHAGYRFITSKKEHQKKNTECGVYSIHFIIEMLNDFDKMLDTIMRGNITDKAMTRYRRKYFNKPTV